MTPLRIFTLRDPAIRERAAAYIRGEAPADAVVKVSEPSRTLDQNSAQWPILEAFSRQLKWPVNGHMVSMEPDDWKDVLTAAFKNETVRLAMGLNGGVVMLGMRTSKMPKRQFSEWLDFLHAVAAERGVDLEVTT